MELWEELREEAFADVDVKVDISVNEKAVITGAGDSFAAALAVSNMLPQRLRALDPLTVATSDLDEQVLVAVSVSGRTARVIDATNMQKRKGKRVIAVTANEESELARIADDIVLLPYRGKSGVPGALTYLESLKALGELFGVEFNDSKLIAEFEISQGSAFLGCGFSIGNAYFAHLKLAETFGWWSLHENLELFAHSPMFISSLSNIVVFSCGSPLEEIITKNFPEATLVRGSVIDQARSIILSLSAAVKRTGVKEPYFLSNKKLLEKSSNIIYGYHLF